MKHKSKSFTIRFSLRSIIVVSVLFLTIYLLFNQIADNLINTTAEENLTLEIRDNFATQIAVLGSVWRAEDIDVAVTRFLDLSVDSTPAHSVAHALLSDRFSSNYVIINDRGVLMTSESILTGIIELIPHDGFNVDKRIFFAEFFRANRDLFNESVNVRVDIGQRIFFVRSIPTDYAHGIDFPPPPTPLTILFFTEVTELINFKQTINQILLITLSISGIIIICSSLAMSKKFDQSVKKLAHYAKELGQGTFDAKIEPLKFSEFQTLAKSMRDMSTMLANYEMNQKQFFQNASHELRTPLMAIQCYNDGIRENVFDPLDATVIINSEVEKMTELVGSILHLSRIDHHAFTLEVVSINEVLRDCYSQVDVLATNNHKSINFTPLEPGRLIKIDHTLFDRAILNILSNALRYVKSEINIVVEPYLNRNIFANIRQNMVRIIISNDGDPIDDEDLPHIFDRFYKGKGGNTGIGLAMTKEIITAFDGTIKVKNSETGVNFIIDLPAHENK